MALTLVVRLALLVIFIVTGIVCGMMFNYALGRKMTEMGGVVGGLLVGFLMWLL
jgi:hypothetical protein